MSKSNRSIIDKLCDLNPQKRLGTTRQGFDGIKKHQWFSGLVRGEIFIFLIFFLFVLQSFFGS